MENFRLKVFRIVVRHLNFRMAAEELLLTQPAVTQQIKALEAELGAALFDRTGGRVALTPAGHALLPFAEQLAELARNAGDAVGACNGLRSGTLTIAASQTIGQYLLPHLLAGFLKENPDATLHVLSGNTQEALELLTTRAADLALIEGPAMRQDVHVQPFMDDHMVCVVAASHPWAGRKVPVARLKDVALVTRELGSGSRRVVEQAIEAAGIALRELHIRMTFDSTEGLLGAVEAGLGIAFVSRWAVRAQLALGTLHIARVEGLKLSRVFSLAARSGPDAGGTAGAFRRYVLEQGLAAARTTPKTGARTAGGRAKSK